MAIDMTAAAKAPPARGMSTRTAKPRQTISDKRTEAVNGIAQLGQAALLMFGQYADAAAVGIHGETVCGEVVKLADGNEKVAKVVDYLLEAGPYAGLVTAILPFALQIAANHKMIPAVGIQGVMPPDVLETSMRAQVELKAAQMRREAEAARSEAAEMMRLAREEESNRWPLDGSGNDPETMRAHP